MRVLDRGGLQHANTDRLTLSFQFKLTLLQISQIQASSRVGHIANQGLTRPSLGRDSCSSVDIIAQGSNICDTAFCPADRAEEYDARVDTNTNRYPRLVPYPMARNSFWEPNTAARA
jgi:hypothetical protein